MDQTNEAGVKAQALYILANLNGWRGEHAKETKAIHKKISLGG